LINNCRYFDIDIRPRLKVVEARMATTEPVQAPIGAPNPVLHKTSGGNAAYHNFNNDFAHIQDPNERRRLALAEIDKAPFGWYAVKLPVSEAPFANDT
jgi:hypothetical protein